MVISLPPVHMRPSILHISIAEPGFMEQKAELIGTLFLKQCPSYVVLLREKYPTAYYQIVYNAFSHWNLYGCEPLVYLGGVESLYADYFLYRQQKKQKEALSSLIGYIERDSKTMHDLLDNPVFNSRHVGKTLMFRHLYGIGLKHRPGLNTMKKLWANLDYQLIDCHAR